MLQFDVLQFDSLPFCLDPHPYSLLIYTPSPPPGVPQIRQFRLRAGCERGASWLRAGCKCVAHFWVRALACARCVFASEASVSKFSKIELSPARGAPPGPKKRSRLRAVRSHSRLRGVALF